MGNASLALGLGCAAAAAEKIRSQHADSQYAVYTYDLLTSLPVPPPPSLGPKACDLPTLLRWLPGLDPAPLLAGSGVPRAVFAPALGRERGGGERPAMGRE